MQALKWLPPPPDSELRHSACGTLWNVWTVYTVWDWNLSASLACFRAVCWVGCMDCVDCVDCTLTPLPAPVSELDLKHIEWGRASVLLTPTLNLDRKHICEGRGEGRRRHAAHPTLNLSLKLIVRGT
eukprot:366379-Chlamydomonas_euryale.AAC.7